MNKFIRYYNQNRREVFIVIIIILFAIFLLHFINFVIAYKKDKKAKETMSSSLQNSTIKRNDNINTYQVIKGSKNVITAENDIDYIVRFIEYCNDGKVDEAYKMISDDCKVVLFPSVEYFKNYYFINIFNTNKSYSIQDWSGPIYKVDFKDNILYTGKIDANTIQDFITVLQDKDGYKLNINNFISKTTLDKTNSINNINIEVISKNTFMSYEVYKIKIKNNNNFTVYLDELNKTNTMYLTDKNGIKYSAYSHELTKELLKINPYSNIEIEIKFTNRYIVDRNMEKITFSNILLENEKREVIQATIKLK